MASTGPHTSSYDYHPIPVPQATSRPDEENTRLKSATVGTSSVNPSLDEKLRDSSTQQPGWTSRYLKKASLLAFAATFLALLLAVIALAVVDAKQDGIANARSNEHYLWTYGPTAVLVIVAALWNQVEYRTKHAMPFAVLQKGPTLASETLLLDYVTPGKPEALWKALRKAHWPVFIAIVNSLLIMLLTVASTGLLVLQETSFTRHNCRLNVTDRLMDSFETSQIGSASVLATIAVANGTIALPPGTSRSAAFQGLTPTNLYDGARDIEIQGSAGLFQAGLNCEVATIVSGPSDCSDWQCHGLNISLTLSSPTCNIESYNLTTGCGMRPDAVTCSFNDTWGVGCDTHVDGHDHNRLVFISGFMKQDLRSASMNGTKPLEILTQNTSTIVCEPYYRLAEAHVIMDQSGNIKNSPVMANASRPSTFPAWDLVDGLLTATTAAGTALDHTYSYKSYDYFPWMDLHTFFLKWTAAAHASSNLTDPHILQSRATEMFSMVTAQMAKQSLMQASPETVLGSCQGIQDRLRVRGLSLYLMGAILVLLIVSTMILLSIVPRGYSSRDPTSIGGLALAVSQSPSLLTQLSKSGSADLNSIRSQLANVECQTFFALRGQKPQMTIDLSHDVKLEQAAAVPKHTQSTTLDYWKPLSLHPGFRFLVVIFLLIMVVVLEVLYSISRKQDGLAKVDPKTYERFAWAYVPAIVMVTAQTLVGMVAFSALLVFPYVQLSRTTSSTRDDVLRHYVSETAITCLWRGLFAKHAVVCCMAFAMMIAPMLTIVVSGLYTAAPIIERQPVTISLHNQFNSSFIPEDLWSRDGSGDIVKAASTNTGLLITQNFTYPLWTYNELAFPAATIDFPESSNANLSVFAGSNVTATLPAIRSSLECSLASNLPGNYTDTLDPLEYNRTRIANVTAFEALGAYDSGSFLPWPRPGSQPFGLFTLCGGSYRNTANTFCGAFGTSETNWRAFTCSSRIEQLVVDIDLDAVSLVVLAARPDEGTARFFSNETLCRGDCTYFPSDIIPAPFGGADFGGQKAVAGFYDPAFQTVVYGLGTHDHLENFAMEAYMDDEGALKIFQQLQHIHRTVIAQSADLLRVPLNASSPLAPQPTINATLMNPHVYRLQQSAVSTRILDGLLLVIALCVALSFLMNPRKVLPKNPASIAAAISLIAGESQMLSKESLTEGAQWYSDSELKDYRVWDGAFFKLGWWDGQTEDKLFKLDTL